MTWESRHHAEHSLCRKMYSNGTAFISTEFLFQGLEYRKFICSLDLFNDLNEKLLCLFV